jgi:uncharacterized membrane protein YbhN (UPF0104 family)
VLTAVPRARLRRTVPIALGAALTVAALLTVVSSAGGMQDVLNALERVSAGWTLAAVAAMLVGYTLLALHLRRLACGQVSIWQAVRADLLLFGVGNVLPGAPAPGALLAAGELRRDGLSARSTRFVLAFTMWFNVRTLLGIGALAFLVAFARQHPGVREAGLWWLAAVGVILALAATARLASRQGTAHHTAQLLARYGSPGRGRQPMSRARQRTPGTPRRWRRSDRPATASCWWPWPPPRGSRTPHAFASRWPPLAFSSTPTSCCSPTSPES